MSDWNPTPGVNPATKEANISVAVMYTGGRSEKMTVPLQATDMDVAVEPPNPWDYDIVALDNADRNMIWPVLRKRCPDTNTKVVYRMRGNVYEEIGRWDMLPMKEWLAKAILRNADGFIAVTPGMATIAKRRAGVDPVGVAGLAKEPSNWPTVTHTDRELRAITLTNADYFEKVEPAVRNAGVFEEWARVNGGQWDIYGSGTHTEWLAHATAQYDHVAFQGYTEQPKATIEDYNLMLHLSDLDALPNAVLEGFAAGLPVLTSAFYAFTESDAPVDVVHAPTDLRETLAHYRTPRTRQQQGARNMAYLREHHTPEHVGQQYVRYFQRLLNDEQ